MKRYWFTYIKLRVVWWNPNRHVFYINKYNINVFANECNS